MVKNSGKPNVLGLHIPVHSELNIAVWKNDLTKLLGTTINLHSGIQFSSGLRETMYFM